jgi:hypothetical protein
MSRARVMSHAARLREVRLEIGRLRKLAAEVLAADLAGDDAGATVLDARVIGDKIIIDTPDGRSHRGGQER